MNPIEKGLEALGQTVAVVVDTGGKVVGAAVDLGGKVVGGAADLAGKVVGGVIEVGGKAIDTTLWLSAEAAKGFARFIHPDVEITRNDVFLVHGHDEQLLSTVYGLIHSWGLNPIMLSKLPGGTLTIKEKLKKHATRPTVGYAVVMLTPDDPCACTETSGEHKRSRQNAVYELGYFMGMFAGERCCVLVKGKPEDFSDIRGLSQISVDEEGRWLQRLHGELLEAGVPIRNVHAGV
jgi:predicted nucleotide-binding protein